MSDSRNPERDRDAQENSFLSEDPDLLVLPTDNRRRKQTLAMMTLAVLAAMALLYRVRGDVEYFFVGGLSDARAIDLGDLSQQTSVGLNENSFVRFSGLPLMGMRMPFNHEMVLAPIAGANAERLWVLTPTDAQVSTEFYGRLVRASDLSLRLPGQTGRTFVLMQGQTPRSVWPSAFIALLCMLIALCDLGIALYWFVPLPLAQEQRRLARN